MFKKFFSLTLIASSLIVLPGCGEEEATPNEISDQNFNQYESDEIGIPVPKDWDIIEPKDFTTDVAKNTILGLRNNVKNDIFTANINIVVNINDGSKSSLEKAKEIYNSERAGVLEYKEITRETIHLESKGEKVESEFIIFEGKNTEEEDLLRYSQVVLASPEKVYIVTGTHKLDEDEKTTNLLHGAIKNFKIK